MLDNLGEGKKKKVRFFSGLDALRKREYDHFKKSYLEGRKNRARVKPGEKTVWSCI